MSIAQITSRLQSVNSILRSCGNGALYFDDALTLVDGVLFFRVSRFPDCGYR